MADAPRVAVKSQLISMLSRRAQHSLGVVLFRLPRGVSKYPCSGYFLVYNVNLLGMHGIVHAMFLVANSVTLKITQSHYSYQNRHKGVICPFFIPFFGTIVQSLILMKFMFMLSLQHSYATF